MAGPGTALSLNVTQVPEEYDPAWMREIVGFLEELLRSVFIRNNHVEIAPDDTGDREPFLILHSPDGTRWKITVDNAGTISATDIGNLGL